MTYQTSAVDRSKIHNHSECPQEEFTSCRAAGHRVPDSHVSNATLKIDDAMNDQPLYKRGFSKVRSLGDTDVTYRRLSSHLIWPLFLLLTLPWAGGLFFLFYDAFLSPFAEGVPQDETGKMQLFCVIAFLSIGLFSSVAACLALGNVVYIKQDLIVFCFRGKATIPLSRIESVKLVEGFNISPIAIRFTNRTKIGRTVYFIPKLHLTIRRLEVHPILDIINTSRLKEAPTDHET